MRKILAQGEAGKGQKDEQRASGWKWAIKTFAVAFLILFAYTFVRYAVFKGVGLEHVPLYLFNKAISITAVVLIGLSFALGPLARFCRWAGGRLYLRKYLGLFGFGMAALHGVISLIILTPAYFEGFFAEGGKLNLTGELSMLFGVLAIFIFSIVSVTSIPSVEAGMRPGQWKLAQRLGYLAFFLVLLHTWAMGYRGWLTPEKWAGGMPPITLLASVIIALVLLLRLVVAISPGRGRG